MQIGMEIMVGSGRARKVRVRKEKEEMRGKRMKESMTLALVVVDGIIFRRNATFAFGKVRVHRPQCYVCRRRNRRGSTASDFVQLRVF